MSSFTIICVTQWSLLFFSTLLLSLKADNCVPSNPQTCGNLTLPYPFRLDENTCGLPGFEIVCNRTSNSDPGIPYLKTLTGQVQVLNISNGQILVDAAASYAFPCDNQINFTSFRAFNLSDEGPFRISGANNFFAVGCKIYGTFQTSLASGNDSYLGYCSSTCIETRTVKPWDCKDDSCCKIPVPGGYTRIVVRASFNTAKEIGNCSYSAVALVDQDSFGSNPESKFQLQGAPYSMQLDWAIPNNTYSSAIVNYLYQCDDNANSEDKGWGYLCKCKSDYMGDGYINGTGCKEIKKCTGVICSQTLSIITGACGALIAVLLGGGSLFSILKLRKSKRDKEKNFQRNGGDHLKNLISSRGGVESMKLFSLKEIEKATNKFSQNLILGSGGYGTVYKGTLTNGRLVAVKKSKQVDSDEIDQFINEVSILSQINHRNVVKLLGCCLETSVPLLVYEYISNGTLFDHLHGDKQEQQHLPWEKRLSIATETAEALSYLHSAASVPIVHRDVKSSNILLDNDYNPKVADFGVSRLVPMGQTHITTVVQGTMGYLDPEYFQTVQLTDKSDVYSFGVVLVELLTGLKPVSYERMKNQSNLAIFFLSTVNTTGFREIVDPRLNMYEGKNMESMRRVAALAKECLSVEGEKRPSMKEVVQELLWSKGGERPHAWLNNDVADNQEEMVGLIVDEEERSEGIRATYSIPQESSFSIEMLGDWVRSGR